LAKHFRSEANEGPLDSSTVRIEGTQAMNTFFYRFPKCLFLVWLVAATAFIGAGKARASWEAEWEKTVAAAKKEGQVQVYLSSNQNHLLIQSGAFQKKFPEIKVVVALGDPLQRAMTERRVGKYLVDIAFTGPGSLWRLYRAKILDPVRDTIILPEIADESKWFEGRHYYVDKERKYIFAAIGNVDLGEIFYNTKLVNPKEYRSFLDFLRPELQGKMTARDVRTQGPGSVTMRIFYYMPELGPGFIRRLFGEMDLTLFRDQRQGIDWLATGKYPICFFCSHSRVYAAQRQGLPVESFGVMKEGAGLIVSGGSISIVNRAPHPNAAKVFINWYLSREGQLAVQRAGGGTANSRRIDIPKDMVQPDRRPQEGVKYYDAENWERISMDPILKELRAAMAEAEKRKKK